ncbi:hypothetical protein D3C81_1760250 [compost metagenome]
MKLRKRRMIKAWQLSSRLKRLLRLYFSVTHNFNLTAGDLDHRSSGSPRWPLLRLFISDIYRATSDHNLALEFLDCFVRALSAGHYNFGCALALHIKSPFYILHRFLLYYYIQFVHTVQYEADYSSNYTTIIKAPVQVYT